MLRPKSNVEVYLYMAPVDMRKSINGLAALVENELALSPMMEVLFVFCNRGRDKIKLLYWERNGFVVWAGTKPVVLRIEACGRENVACVIYGGEYII
jgi:hypothetical protein